MSSPVTVAPAPGPVDAVITPPGSKSGTLRSLVAAALANGRSHLYGALASEDSEAMIRLLEALGVNVETHVEPWAVDGKGGYLTAPDYAVDVGESGLTGRIALVLAAMAEGTTTIVGRGRLPRRPFQGLIDALASQGVDIVSTDGGLPMTVTGQGGLWGGPINIDCSASSQFATALMLAAPLTTEPTALRVEGLAGSAGYLGMTITVMRGFGAQVAPTITGFDISNSGYEATDIAVEPDASAATYPMVAAAITGGRVELRGLTSASTQPDISLAARLASMGCTVSEARETIVIEGPEPGGLTAIESDLSDAPDASLALAVACAFASGTSRLSGLHSLRLKESDRLSAMHRELSKLGCRVEIEGDTLVITGSAMHPARVDPHGDHRIAMACALVGLVVEGVTVEAPEVVNKTWPGFWDMLEELVLGNAGTR